MANFIASDAHSLNRRNSSLIEGYEVAKAIDKDMLARVQNNLNLMLSNKDLNVDMEKIKKKKSIFNFLMKNN